MTENHLKDSFFMEKIARFEGNFLVVNIRSIRSHLLYALKLRLWVDAAILFLTTVKYLLYFKFTGLLTVKTPKLAEENKNFFGLKFGKF